MNPQQINLFDHGYVKLIETWGSDERIIEAARMSTDKGFLGWDYWECKTCKCRWRDNGDNTVSLADAEQRSCSVCEFNNTYECCERKGDQKLLAYLYNNHHMTPFEMGGMVIEVQAPIFVFREWHRHRTQSYNELSARYTELPDLFYVPELGRIQKQSDKNKQGSGSSFGEDQAEYIQNIMRSSFYTSRKLYQELLDEGLAREIARLVIPVAQYSKMRASANLRNWLQFLTLRLAPGAQYEIRMYANAVSELISLSFPRTHKLFIGK